MVRPRLDLMRLAWGVLLVFAATVARGQGCDAVRDITTARRTIAVEGRLDTGLQPLPDHLPTHVRTERHRISYVLDVSTCSNDAARALSLFRVGAPFRILSDAGLPLAPLTSSSPPALATAMGFVRTSEYNGRIPALFALPSGTKTVTLELLTLPYIPAGLVAAQTGPVQALVPVQASAHRDVVAFADTGSGLVLVFGLLSVLLWRQRRGDTSLLWLSVACALWGLRGLAYFNAHIYVSAVAFELLNTVIGLVALGALGASVFIRYGQLTARAAAALAIPVVAGTLAAMGAAVAGRGAVAARVLCLIFVVAILMWMFVRAARAWRRPSSRTLAVLLGILLAATAHDFAVIAGLRPPGSPSVLFWGFTVLLVGVCVMSAQYVAAMLSRAENANEELILRVAQKSDELARSYEQLRDIERQNARTAERERLVRDLHDGLSAQLVTALRGVERGALGPQAVAGSLQDSLDELRMLMDSRDIGDWLPAALAAWRNRWESRLQAAGVELEWHIEDTVDGVLLGGDATMQVMRILQEAAANIVKHSRASRMRLGARVQALQDGADLLMVDVVDDGIGVGVVVIDESRGRGIRNMMHRARQIGARLDVGPGPAGTGTRVALTLALPVKREATGA